jgi:hypothetical protein
MFLSKMAQSQEKGLVAVESRPVLLQRDIHDEVRVCQEHGQVITASFSAYAKDGRCVIEVDGVEWPREQIPVPVMVYIGALFCEVHEVMIDEVSQLSRDAQKMWCVAVRPGWPGMWSIRMSFKRHRRIILRLD